MFHSWYPKVVSGLQDRLQVPPSSSSFSRLELVNLHLSWQWGLTQTATSSLLLPGWWVCPRSLFCHSESGQCWTSNTVGLPTLELSLCFSGSGVVPGARALFWSGRARLRQLLLRGEESSGQGAQQTSLLSHRFTYLPRDLGPHCLLLSSSVLLCGMGGLVSVQGPGWGDPMGRSTSEVFAADPGDARQ